MKARQTAKDKSPPAKRFTMKRYVCGYASQVLKQSLKLHQLLSSQVYQCPPKTEITTHMIKHPPPLLLSSVYIMYQYLFKYLY